MRPNGIKLSRTHQAVLYAAFLALYASGVTWYVLHDALAWLGEVPEDWSSPVEPFLLQIHGAAAMLALLVLGSLMPQHIKWAWTGKMNRSTGALMLSTQALLILTGYALYYAGDEGLRSFASGLHLVIGLGFPLLLVWHIVEGRRREAARRAAATRPRPRAVFAREPARVSLRPEVPSDAPGRAPS